MSPSSATKNSVKCNVKSVKERIGLPTIHLELRLRGRGQKAVGSKLQIRIVKRKACIFD